MFTPDEKLELRSMLLHLSDYYHAGGRSDMAYKAEAFRAKLSPVTPTLTVAWLTQERIQDIHSAAFVKAAADYPKGCCAGRTWSLEVEDGVLYVVTPFDSRPSVESDAWTARTTRTGVSRG